MTDATRKSGRCLCGAVRFTAVTADTMHACHCEICRRQSGGVFLSVDCGDSVVVEDEAALTTFESSDWAERQFCARCGSNLFWRGKDGATVMASIQAFDDPSVFVFADEFCIDAKPSTYAFAGDRPRLTTDELMAMFTSEAS